MAGSKSSDFPLVSVANCEHGGTVIRCEASWVHLHQEGSRCTIFVPGLSLDCDTGNVWFQDSEPLRRCIAKAYDLSTQLNPDSRGPHDEPQLMPELAMYLPVKDCPGYRLDPELVSQVFRHNDADGTGERFGQGV